MTLKPNKKTSKPSTGYLAEDDSYLHTFFRVCPNGNNFLIVSSAEMLLERTFCRTSTSRIL